MDKKEKSLYEAVESYAKQIGSNYRDIRKCRDDLLDFMDANEWFGQKVMGTGDRIYLEQMEPAYKGLDLWLRAYGRTDEEKLKLLLELCRTKYPRTYELYSSYITTNGENMSASMRTLDYLLSALDREIMEYNDDQIQMLITEAGRYLGTIHLKLLMDFLETLKKDGLHMAWTYKTAGKKQGNRDNDAFTIEEFAKMAYWVFSEEAWAAQNLVAKAAASGRCAKLWLFIALHFVCALRKTDMEKLPAPVLSVDASILRARIVEGDFSDAEAEAVSDEWMFLIEMIVKEPGKTSRYDGIPDLKVFIPQSLKKSFGIILVMAVSHYVPGTQFISSYAEQGLIETFFGEDFTSASGLRYFRTRKANKAFLQGIESSAESEVGKPKGYMLAALARSHKGGIGLLSQITDIYLKDENFTGYKPEFILREMFERGIFGFVPVMLLEAYAGKQFRQLGVSRQTQMIKSIGLLPAQIEDLARCVSDSMDRAEKVVESLLVAEDRKAQLEKALQMIATDRAPSKQPDICCARMAMGYRCDSPDRSSCIGCGYEVYTKSALQILMKEYNGLLLKLRECDGFERMRLSSILKKGVIPAITEIISSVPILYPDADMAPMEKILERGIHYAAIESD